MTVQMDPEQVVDPPTEEKVVEPEHPTEEQVVKPESTDSIPEVEKEETGDERRGKGVSTFDYLVTLMGYAIGIGNLWRFPYLVGRWGGGSFVIAYLVCLVLVASPMYLAELHLGQYSRLNTLECFRCLHPRWVGLAVTVTLMIIFLSMYYNTILAYSCVYLVGSLYSPLPWTTDALGDTGDVSASEYYWKHTVLNQFDYSDLTANSMDGAGDLQWRLVLGLLFVWTTVFFTLWKGLATSAKVSYVTVGLPIVCLIIMLIRAVTLEGAADGVEFYIGKFDGEKLYDFEMWAAACGQILFSLSPGMGIAVTLSSFTRPNEDVFRINAIVSICNSTFSFLCGFAVFSILGFMSHRSCQADNNLVCHTVDDLAASSGTSLAFVTLAEAVAQFGDGSNVFAVLFFLMLLTLGLDSTFATIETLNTYVHDFSYKFKEGGVRKEFVGAGVALFFFLMGLPFCTRIGVYILDVFDTYAVSYPLIYVIWMQCMMLWSDWSWELMCHGIREATRGNPGFPDGREMWVGWRVVLFGTAPVISCGLFFYYLIKGIMEPSGYPVWLATIGWIVLVVVISPSIITCIMYFKAEPIPLPNGKRTRHFNLEPDMETPADNKVSASEPIAS